MPFLSAHACQIWLRSDGRVKRGVGYRHTDYETFTSMSCTTVNNVSNVGGDPVTQLIVNVYQIIKL